MLHRRQASGTSKSKYADMYRRSGPTPTPQAMLDDASDKSYKDIVIDVLGIPRTAKDAAVGLAKERAGQLVGASIFGRELLF